MNKPKGVENEPRGVDLLATLIELLADQEGVKISYVIESLNGEKRIAS